MSNSNQLPSLHMCVCTQSKLLWPVKQEKRYSIFLYCHFLFSVFVRTFQNNGLEVRQDGWHRGPHHHLLLHPGISPHRFRRLLLKWRRNEKVMWAVKRSQKFLRKKWKRNCHLTFINLNKRAQVKSNKKWNGDLKRQGSLPELAPTPGAVLN